MPEMSGSKLDDLFGRLVNFLSTKNAYSVDQSDYISSGGSAAVYRITTPEGVRAIKVYDPDFLEGPGGDAERRRLSLQRDLIGHGCENLVRIYSVVEAEDTAFVEMEFVDWPNLADVLADVPDESVGKLILQLVDAVKFLESRDIAHRDIKPENIHVSPEFEKLVLLDLGVARELDFAEDETIAVTDHGVVRPFIATAQYSSPEYLFRLDEPTPRLWKGLSLYQVGAVLHDLIMKKPLFHSEVEVGNKWVLTKAVLMKMPSFSDSASGRLSALKSVASRCLTKDLDARLQLVDWIDFEAEARSDPLSSLSDRLNRPRLGAGGAKALSEKITYERKSCVERIREGVRGLLIETCSNALPLSVMPIEAESPDHFKIEFCIDGYMVLTYVEFDWKSELHVGFANVLVACVINRREDYFISPDCKRLLCGVAEMSGDSEEVIIRSVSENIARSLGLVLDQLEAGADLCNILGTDLIDVASDRQRIGS